MQTFLLLSLPVFIATGIVRPFFQSRASLLSALVVNIKSDQIQVRQNQQNYSIYISPQTVFLKHYWGSSNLSQVKTGHLLDISGRWDQDDQSIIKADFVRNLSQNDWVIVAIGNIVSVSPRQITIISSTRGQLSVPLSPSLPPTNYKIGQKIKVIGSLDRSTSVLSSVSQIILFDSTPTSRPQSDPDSLL